MSKKSEIKINTIINSWLESIKISVKPSTYSTYYSIVHNHIIKEIGDLDITQINKKLLDKFIIKQYTEGRVDGEGGLSAKSISDISALLTSIIKFAYENGHIRNNPFNIVKPRQVMKEIDVFTEDEQIKLENYLCNNLNTKTAGVLICLYTGIRIGELCALKIDDIDFNKGILRINKNIQRIKNLDLNAKTKTKIIVDSPKSKKPRYIPIPSVVIDKIQPIYREYTDDCYILTGTKKYIEPRTYRNVFKKYLQASYVRELNFHALRHTFATRCVEANFDIKTLSEILGHSNVSITLGTYVHSSYELKIRQMEKLHLLCQK